MSVDRVYPRAAGLQARGDGWSQSDGRVMLPVCDARAQRDQDISRSAVVYTEGKQSESSLIQIHRLRT